MKYFVSCLIYVGFGFLVHYLFEGSVIDWSDAGSIAMIALWPFYLIWQFIMIVFWIGVVVLVLGAGFITFEHFRNN